MNTSSDPFINASTAIKTPIPSPTPAIANSPDSPAPKKRKTFAEWEGESIAIMNQMQTGEELRLEVAKRIS